jgi:predicted butyrate kinase (DUF1464 family)
LTAARDASDEDLRLAYLAAEGEPGGIGGLRALVRLLARTSIPVVLTPGVIHLPSVPPHRKVNRIDMGTADKVCAAVLAIREYGDAPFVLLELGGAFSAALAIAGGRIVDGAGGTSGPMGVRAAGALDGEVAYLAGTMAKSRLFTGGAASVAGLPAPDADALVAPVGARARLARDAYIESAAKAVASLGVSLGGIPRVVLSGRLAGPGAVRDSLEQRLAAAFPGVVVEPLAGFARVAKHAAQGAALLADGLAGGRSAPLVDRMGIRDAAGTVLDHLYLITPAQARQRLGLDP